MNLFFSIGLRLLSTKRTKKTQASLMLKQTLHFTSAAWSFTSPAPAQTVRAVVGSRRPWPAMVSDVAMKLISAAMIFAVALIGSALSRITSNLAPKAPGGQRRANGISAVLGDDWGHLVDCKSIIPAASQRMDNSKVFRGLLWTQRQEVLGIMIGASYKTKHERQGGSPAWTYSISPTQLRDTECTFCWLQHCFLCAHFVLHNPGFLRTTSPFLRWSE